MSNFNIISTRIPPSAYVDLKTILDTKNVTISEFLKSAVDERISKGAYIDVDEKHGTDILVVMAITTLTLFTCYQIYKFHRNKTNPFKNDER